MVSITFCLICFSGLVGCSLVGEITIGNFTPVNILHRGLTLNDQFINASGIYLLTLPEAGRLTEVNFQGYTFDEQVQIILDRQALFFLTLHVALYRTEGNRYLLTEGPLRVSYEPGAIGRVENLNWNVQAGDSIGVIIPDMCNETSATAISCPCQVNLRTSQCLSAKYHPSVANMNVLMTEDLQQVQVDLNIQFTVQFKGSTSGGGRSDGAVIALGVVLAVVLLICLGLLVVVVIMVVSVKTKYIKKRKADDAVSKVDDKIRADNAEITVNAERSNRSKSPEYHEYNEISDEPHTYEKTGGIPPNSVVQETESAGESGYEDSGSPVAVYSGYAVLEPYFEPATSKDDIITQIKDEIHIPVEKVENLELKEILGSGEFGTVYKAILTHDDGEFDIHSNMEVAVKTVNTEVSQDEMVKFLQEAAIMGQFNHPSIVQILGIVVDDPVMIIINLMKGGDLRNHLHKKRKSLSNLNIKEIQSTLLSYSRQICCAMALLEKKGYVHRDLAARNILISSDGSNVKISDFGLSRDLQSENFYISHGGKVPVKWTAPEALKFRWYSHESDVWSYGCLLYEIWSLGYKPYHDWDNQKVMKEVAKGYRLPPPPGCPRLIYEVMIQCWLFSLL